MVNEKTGLRELAYIVKIDDILPIQGSDNCECAVVGGWHVMVRKGTFHTGDAAVYFEIDSRVDVTKPQFSFLAKYNGKVKSQRYTFGGKGNFLSQGLIMPLSDFGWTVADHSIKTFVTKELNVTYYDPEDNVRKNGTSKENKYAKMAARNPQLFKKPFVKWLMRKEWGRKFLWLLFKNKNKGHGGFPTHFPYIKVTDEERCLPGPTKLLTDQGWLQINKIVNHKLKVKVASMNNDGTISFKEILDYQKFLNNTKPMITIKYPYRLDVARTNALCCTEDHKCLTERGYIEAKDITTKDKVFMPTEAFTEDSLYPIYGMLLGDSHIYNDKRDQGLLRIVATNGEKQLDYLKYKYGLYNDGKIVNSGIGSYGKLPSYHWYMGTDPYISSMVRADWYSTGKKTITKKVIDKINEISLAFWYMDDGNLAYNHENKTSYVIRLNTQGFSYDENILLCNMLNDKFDIRAKVNKDKIAKDGYQMYMIHITSTSEADKFFQLIAPYICESMYYKLPAKWIETTEFKQLHYEKKYRVLPIPVLSVEKGQTKNKAWSKNFNIVYDIEVADNHNFVADNIIVHNCENLSKVLEDKTPMIVTEKLDGTSSTYILERKSKKKFEFYVLSRRVRQLTPDQKCYHDDNIYWNMAFKYDIEKHLRKYLEDNPSLDYVCIQGESVGNVQGNPLKLKEDNLYLYNFIRSDCGRVDSLKGKEIVESWGMNWVPIIDTAFILPDTMEELKTQADGVSVLNPRVMREGLVYRKTADNTFSFKNVSNKYLLSKGE